MPFANPAAFVVEAERPHIARQEDIACRWIRDGGRVVAVDLYVRGRLFARLAPGAKPGWSRLAKRPGPLALPLAEVQP
jgi:hypothetical protein